MVSSSKMVAKLQAILAWWRVHTLIDADETCQVEVVDPVPLVRGILDEGVDLPAAVRAAETYAGVDDRVGRLQIDWRVDQPPVLSAVPLRVAFDRGESAQHRPFVAGNGVEGPVRRLRHLGRDDVSCRGGHPRNDGFQMGDSQLQVEAMYRHHRKLELAALDLGIHIFDYLRCDIQDRKSVV